MLQFDNEPLQRFQTHVDVHPAQPFELFEVAEGLSPLQPRQL